MWAVQLSAEKHTREAELKAERSKLAKLEEEYSADRIRLTSDLSKAQQGEAEAVKELRDAQKRARDAVAARDVIRERADDRYAPPRLLWLLDRNTGYSKARKHVCVDCGLASKRPLQLHSGSRFCTADSSSFSTYSGVG